MKGKHSIAGIILKHSRKHKIMWEKLSGEGRMV